MHRETYPYERIKKTRYLFFSIGKKGTVLKAVEFSVTAITDLYNLGFGDLLPDDIIDDVAQTDNGDMSKVLATVISIVVDFTNRNPQYKILFTGSTQNRTKFYQRILNSYYSVFSAEFVITGIVQNEAGELAEIKFVEKSATHYVAFIVKRKLYF